MTTITVVTILVLYLARRFRGCWAGLIIIGWSLALLLGGWWECLHGRKVEWPQ